MFRPYITLWDNAGRLKALTIHDLTSRYIRSAFGFFWIFAFPALFLLIYAYTYLYIFKVSSTVFEPEIFVLVIFSGLIPFISFQESFQSSANAIVNAKALLSTTIYPVEILPVQVVLSTLPVLVVGLTGLLLGIAYMGKLPVTALLLPVAVLLQLQFLIGLAWLTSTITVFFRDFSQIAGLTAILLMLLSPLGYTREQVPANLGWFSKINPLFYMIEFYRDLLFRGAFDTTTLVIWVLLSFGTFQIGYYVFSRLKPIFSDYV